MLMRTKTSSYAVMNVILVFILALSGVLGFPQPAAAAGTISLATLGAAYSQNFDTLALSGTSSTVPTGWEFIEAGTNANTTYTAGTGSGNAGDTYSFGAADSADRAFGGLLSGSLVPTIGASFTNNTGSVISSLEISYTGEQWRLGATGRTDRLDFQYSLDATSVTTGTWIDVDALDFNGPISTGTVGALNGNDSANQAAVSASIVGLSIANGAAFWIRWSDFNASGADDGLSVDNFSLTPSGEAVVSDPMINEFVLNHVGTDTHEYVEIFGAPNTDYSAFSILQIEGDGTGAGVVDSVHTLGTTDADGYWFTGFLSNAFENGTVTLLLVEGFSGAVGNDLDTNNDGVFDVTPWARLVDDVSVSDGGAGDYTYSGSILAPGFSGNAFTPGGASRIPNGVDTGSVSDWTVNDFDGEGLPGFTGTPVPGEAYNTPGAINALVILDPVVVINEIDYDQPGTDTAEFIELKNNSTFPVNLASFTIELVNGNAGGAVIYQTIVLPAVELAAGDYYVVCANVVTVANCDLDVTPDTNLIQNGAPDAVGLRYNGELVDAVSYEGDTGAPYTEGSGVGLVDDAAGFTSISRCPDGFDSNQNNIDFALVNSTPGVTNACEASVLLSINDVSLNEGNSGITSFDFTVSLSAPAPAGGVTFDIATADGTATVAGNDYIAASLTGQSIPAGNSSYNFSVQVNGDTIAEPDETFFVNVTNVTGAVILDGQGLGTIVNDDGVAVTPIHAIQGSGSTVAPGTFTIEAIVVGDYQTQGDGQLRGFFVQEEDADADADPATSEGIFVFCTTCPVPVSVGDLVRVTGSSSEFFNMSQLTASTIASVTVVSSGNPLPTPASITASADCTQR
jgi:uncharacterized protein